jgi:myosin heavy subunit
MAQYRSGDPSLPPHIFAISDAARRQARLGKSQSIVISGESGSGKTEAAKYVMQYIVGSDGTSDSTIVDRILQTSPILESFGNAKTIQNHNSSRFGKLVQLHFDADSRPTGATIRTFLLEKSRIAKLGRDERSFHVFYQLLNAKSSSAADFNFLCGAAGAPAAFEVEGVEDLKEWSKLLAAMQKVGLSDSEHNVVAHLLMGVLQLGQLSFEAISDDACRCASPSALVAVAQLFGVEANTLDGALVSRKITAHGRSSAYDASNSASKAAEVVQSLAKAVYSAIFDWLVSRLNQQLRPAQPEQVACNLSIVDIYGFEQFETNSFEQLCINYANEKLQQDFCQHVIKAEVNAYRLEGIEWQDFPVTDNLPCLQLIEDR